MNIFAGYILSLPKKNIIIKYIVFVVSVKPQNMTNSLNNHFEQTDTGGNKKN